MPSARFVGRGALLGYGAKVAVTTVTSTGTTLPNYGIVSFGATGAKTWSAAAPVKGQRVSFYCNDGATGAIQKVSLGASTARNFVSTGGLNNVALFNKDHEVLDVIGLSSVSYLVLSNLGVTFATG